MNFGKLEVDTNVKEVIKENSKGDASLLYLPNEKLDSKFVTYDLYVAFWQFLPEFVRIRTPQLFYRATDNGYNIRNFYAACENYQDSYYFCLIFIKTTDGGILGVMIDEVPLPTSRNVF